MQFRFDIQQVAKTDFGVNTRVSIPEMWVCQAFEAHYPTG